MFKIEENVPYEPTLQGKKAAEKQALINQVALLKPGQSILVLESELQYTKVKKFVEDVLQERFSQKKLVYKK